MLIANDRSKTRIMLVSLRNNRDIIQEELGIGYICSYLRENGFGVKLESIYTEEFDYKVVFDYKPEIIGFSVYDDSLRNSYIIANTIKKQMPEVKVVFGGYAPTYHAKEIMESCDSVDVVIMGEGEKAFLNVAHAFAKKRTLEECKGILYRKGTVIVENEGSDCIRDLDELPFPARDILLKEKLSTAYVSTSRGCTGKCRFCCSPRFFDIGWRGRSVESVIEEIKELYVVYAVKRIHFIDSSFEDPDIHLSRLNAMLDQLIELNYDITYSADFRVDFYKKATNSVLNKLKKLDFIYVFLGVEAGNDIDLKVYGKNATINDIEECMALFKRNGINVDIGFINFNPYSTVLSLRQNMKFLHKYGLDSYLLNIRQLRIYIGTELYEQVVNDGLYIDDYNYHFVDNDIEKMYMFISRLFEREKEHKFMLLCQHYSVNYRHNILRIKRLGFERIAEEISESLKNLLEEISDKNFTWFNNLIDLAEIGWDDEKAMLITKEQLEVDYLMKCMQRFFVIKERIKKRNPEIANLL